MRIIVFIRTLLLGPLFTAIILTLDLIVFAPEISPDIYNALAFLSITIVVAYIKVFTTAIGHIPVIFPLLAYSLLLSISIKPFCNHISDLKINKKTTIFFSAILGIIIGVIIYGGCHLLAAQPVKFEKLNFLWYLVTPTSAIFGAWAGLSYVREHS